MCTVADEKLLTLPQTTKILLQFTATVHVFVMYETKYTKVFLSSDGKTWMGMLGCVSVVTVPATKDQSEVSMLWVLRSKCFISHVLYLYIDDLVGLCAEFQLMLSFLTISDMVVCGTVTLGPLMIFHRK